jgi:hypothetical protein
MGANPTTQQTNLTTEQWIDESIKIGRHIIFPEPYPGKTLLLAFLSLKGLRDQSEYFGNDELACAEHYMLARFLVGAGGGFESGYPLTIFLIGSYQLWKVTAFVCKKCTGLNLPIRLGKGPATPPSAAQVMWEMRGAERGLVDAPFGLIGPGFIMDIVAYAQDLRNAQPSAASAGKP